MKRRQQIRLRLGMLLVVMLCGLTGVQQAEAQAAVVTLRLSSPANETSARLTAAVYKQDGAIVGQFAATLLLFGTATASVTTTVTTVPDTVEVTLQQIFPPNPKCEKPVKQLPLLPKAF
jgi:hypothetical protein